LKQPIQSNHSNDKIPKFESNEKSSEQISENNSNEKQIRFENSSIDKLFPPNSISMSYPYQSSPLVPDSNEFEPKSRDFSAESQFHSSSQIVSPSDQPMNSNPSTDKIRNLETIKNHPKLIPNRKKIPKSKKMIKIFQNHQLQINLKIISLKILSHQQLNQ
jgi:hypothetical protein